MTQVETNWQFGRLMHQCVMNYNLQCKKYNFLTTINNKSLHMTIIINLNIYQDIEVSRKIMV